MNAESQQPPIVELRGARLERPGEPPFDLRLCPGELALIERHRELRQHLLEQVLQGTSPPASGEVLFDGQSWEARSTRETESARRRIGRVFGSPTAVSNWVQNLSVSDNILLAQRFSPGIDEALLRQRADHLAELFGLGSLPVTRPAATPGDKLLLAQWVRALLPAPLRLLILEIAEPELAEKSSAPLLEAIAEARSKGTAVLWIGDPNHRSFGKGKLSPSQAFTQSGDGRIIAEK